jgi:hypothetical protein
MTTTPTVHFLLLLGTGEISKRTACGLTLSHDHFIATKGCSARAVTCRNPQCRAAALRVVEVRRFEWLAEFSIGQTVRYCDATWTVTNIHEPTEYGERGGLWLRAADGLETFATGLDPREPVTAVSNA